MKNVNLDKTAAALDFMRTKSPFAITALKYNEKNSINGNKFEHIKSTNEYKFINKITKNKQVEEIESFLKRGISCFSTTIKYGRKKFYLKASVDVNDIIEIETVLKYSGYEISHYFHYGETYYSDDVGSDTAYNMYNDVYIKDGNLIINYHKSKNLILSATGVYDGHIDGELKGYYLPFTNENTHDFISRLLSDTENVLNELNIKARERRKSVINLFLQKMQEFGFNMDVVNESDYEDNIIHVLMHYADVLIDVIINNDLFSNKSLMTYELHYSSLMKLTKSIEEIYYCSVNID